MPTKKSPYLKAGRLPDVLALVQVLAIDEHTHRSKSGLKSELQGVPQTADAWEQIAREHPEFFRVTDEDHSISLVARHVMPKDEHGDRPFPSEYTSTLLRLAVELHDREVRRSQSWHAWLPILSVILGGLLTLAGAWLTSN